MSKKTFKTVPKQPTPEAIDQFINDGHGRDVAPAPTPIRKNTETQKSVNTEKPARLTVDLPASLHRRFKSACSLAGVKMNEEIRQFIEDKTAELEK